MIRSHAYPIVGSWYKDLEQNQNFEVVATDPQENTIEIQYFGGEITELDEASWYEMELLPIAPPKDWSGPFEMEREELNDLDQTDKAIHPIDWSGPRAHLQDLDNNIIEDNDLNNEDDN